jgi:nucleotide-binding universal stress UspA family protein
MTPAQQSTRAPSAQETIRPKIRRELNTKILVGIGSDEGHIPALDLLGRLRFPESEITLLHAVDTAYPIPDADGAKEAEYARVMENIGRRLLPLAKNEAQLRRLEVKTELVFGRAADCLRSRAERDNSQLIAVCATKHGPWSSGYMGSATCSLALNATQSLLVAKPPIHHKSTLRVVLGIDQSTKVDALLQRFVDLAPQGIEEIFIVSAYQIDDEIARAAHEELPMLGGDIDRFLLERFSEKNADLVRLLTGFGYRAQSSVDCAAPVDALQAAMKDFRADLLIIGGTGDASPAGSKIGSVALHEIIAEPYSVLMLRG